MNLNDVSEQKRKKKGFKKMKTTTELKAIYDTRAQFYGKAQVHRNGTRHTLQSYNTPILCYNEADNTITFLTSNKSHFSSTTNRHINEFLKQYTNETPKSKQELLKMANII